MQTCLVPRPRAEMGAHHQSHGRPWAEMSAHHQSQGRPRSMGAQGRPWNHTNPRIGSQPTNETINHSSYGTDPQQKNPHHYRFLFNNINGIHFSSTSILELMSIARGLQLDWCGFGWNSSGHSQTARTIGGPSGHVCQTTQRLQIHKLRLLPEWSCLRRKHKIWRGPSTGHRQPSFQNYIISIGK